MLADVSAGWGIVSSVIAAMSGLGGVAVGGWITAINQKHERKNTRIRQQLAEFYSPMLGMRKDIRTKSEVRSKLHVAGNRAWQKLFEGIHDPASKKAISDTNFPRFEKIIVYSDDQLEEDLVPSYQKMLDLFTENMWLAEPSTREHYPALLEFVELWNRKLNDSLPTEVLEFIEHKESSLFPFYEDIQCEFDRLTAEMKE